MLRSMILTAAFTAAIFFNCQNCHAEEAPAGYPGNFSVPDGSEIVAVNIALRMVQEGVYAYQLAFGDWPDSWQEVVSSGICQVAITSPQGYAVDPDDNSLDFMWDVAYIPPADYYTPPKTIALMDVNGPFVSTDPFESNNSLEKAVASLPEAEAQPFHGLVEDMEWRKMAAIKQYCERMMLSHYRLSCWQTWEEFVNSPWSPVNAQALNPLTGASFRFDGGPQDFLVTVVNPEGRISLQITDANGEVPFGLY